MNLSWFLGGDFNEILSVEEEKGVAAISYRKCDLFRERIEACNLMDHSFLGHMFTWRGPIFHGGFQIYERLDRALCNGTWRLQFPDSFVKVLTRMEFLDHYPNLISLMEKDDNNIYIRFRFESA